MTGQEARQGAEIDAVEKCRYMAAAYPTLDASDTCGEFGDHRHDEPTFALARVIAEVFQNPEPSDEQVAALARRTQLRRTPMPVRKKALATRRTATSSWRRGTGPSTRTRQLVAERAGWCCEICGRSLHDGRAWTEDHSVHHRRPRGAGGSRDATTNSPANLMLLCGSGVSGCHGRVERDRSSAYVFGWLVRQGQDPAAVPLWAWARPERPVFLTVDGTYRDEAEA